ncbi:hypothetical protein, partial [uncultured Parasutterella sp.]|uniref:hypothetical protein n=1 Tax=uncultured Parasutterella sp. TaxID=1263098 RepID=UPI0025949647
GTHGLYREIVLKIKEKSGKKQYSRECDREIFKKRRSLIKMPIRGLKASIRELKTQSAVSWRLPAVDH